jgi:3-oxoacid CoA-transferase subunit B
MHQDSKRPLTEEEMARRVAQEVKEGMCINLGAGMPFPVVNYIPKDIWVMVHMEHGILGVAGAAQEPMKDRDLMGLGRRPLAYMPGASCFSSIEAFTMLRGGHIDLSVLGAFQASASGDIANWLLPGHCPIVGGAMDIVGHVKRLICMMTHLTKKGVSKVVKKCNLPVTRHACVDMIITDHAVMDVTPDGLVLLEAAPGFTPEEIQEITEPELIIKDPVKPMPTG